MFGTTQGQGTWDQQTIQNLVSRQSMQLGHLTHLLHWRPAFPLTHTSPAFWQKLLPSLASSQLLADAELSFVSSLAGDFCRLCLSHQHYIGHLYKHGQASPVIPGCNINYTTFLACSVNACIVTLNSKTDCCPVQDVSRTCIRVKFSCCMLHQDWATAQHVDQRLSVLQRT